jgi:hypothetical protein
MHLGSNNLIVAGLYLFAMHDWRCCELTVERMPDCSVHLKGAITLHSTPLRHQQHIAGS